jgi:hypothetical protein
VECLPSEDHNKPAQFIPIRFVPTNKLSKDTKLLLAFDALALSEMLGQEVTFGKIIHGDKHATLNVRTSPLALKVRQHIAKIDMLLSSPSSPNLVLIPHCAECEFQTRCREKALENDDLSLLAGMTERERSTFSSHLKTPSRYCRMPLDHGLFEARLPSSDKRKNVDLIGSNRNLSVKAWLRLLRQPRSENLAAACSQDFAHSTGCQFPTGPHCPATRCCRTLAPWSTRACPG